MGYSENETKILDYVRNLGFNVFHTNQPVENFVEFDLVVSFGYRHLISEKALKTNAKMINIHLSYLPWNKGAHPNFWSHWDGTPSGISIHEIDAGIDSGPIIIQKLVVFSKNEVTFKTTYNKLFQEAEDLFITNFDKIINQKYIAFKPRNTGTVHKVNELPLEFAGWESNIDSEIARLENSGFNPNKKYLDIINKIESARTTNNVNWMDLLRVVAQKSPSDLRKITRRIHEQDIQILDLFKQLNE